MSAPEFDHPDVVLCPGGPMLLRGDHVVEDRDGSRAPDVTAGERGVPLRQVRLAAVVRRHAQARSASRAAKRA